MMTSKSDPKSLNLATLACVLAAALLAPRAHARVLACPAGMTLIGNTINSNVNWLGKQASYCIELNKHAGGSVTYAVAVDACAQLGYDLCSLEEWMTACNANPAGGDFTANVSEWVATPPEYAALRFTGTTNQRLIAGTVGGNCNFTPSSANAVAANAATPFRCCLR